MRASERQRTTMRATGAPAEGAATGGLRGQGTETRPAWPGNAVNVVLPEPFDPAACIAIEDSRWGLEAAHLAGLRCVAVTHTYPAGALDRADLIVGSLGELTLTAIEALLAP